MKQKTPEAVRRSRESQTPGTVAIETTALWKEARIIQWKLAICSRATTKNYPTPHDQSGSRIQQHRSVKLRVADSGCLIPFDILLTILTLRWRSACNGVFPPRLFSLLSVCFRWNRSIGCVFRRRREMMQDFSGSRGETVLDQSGDLMPSFMSRKIAAELKQGKKKMSDNKQ